MGGSPLPPPIRRRTLRMARDRETGFRRFAKPVRPQARQQPRERLAGALLLRSPLGGRRGGVPRGQHGTHSERGDKGLRRSRTLQRALSTVVGCYSRNGGELRSGDQHVSTLSGGHLNIAQIMRAAAGQHGASHVAHNFSALCSGARPKPPLRGGWGASSAEVSVRRCRARRLRDPRVDPQRLKRRASRARRLCSESFVPLLLQPDA